MARMGGKKDDVFTGDDFLAEYKRISENASPQPISVPPESSRDSTTRVINALAESPMTFDALQSATGIDFLELSDIITRLVRISAVEVSSQKTIVLTPHGRDLAGVVAAS